MFSYIRWFSGASFVGVVCAAIFFGHLFKEIGSGDLTDVVDNNNAALAQGFINTTWKSYGAQMKNGAQLYHKFRASGVEPSKWMNYKDYQGMMNALDTFSLGVFKHFEDMPIVEVRIYLPDGTRLISTNPSHIVSPQGSSSLFGAQSPQVDRADGAFEEALRGENSSKVEENASFLKADGTPTKGVLIRTMVPIHKDGDVPILVEVGGSGSHPVEAVVEISYDVTEQWKRLGQFEWKSSAAIIIAYFLVVAFLLYTAARAEHIIAKQYEANLELAAQAASAQAENRDKSQFLANVSHELRTPLNAIIGFSEFIKSERSGPIANDKYAEYIKDIHSSGVHLLSLINDILDYSKAEADKLELEISEVDVTKSIKNAMRLVSPRAESAQVQLIEEIPREHFILKTDAKKLKQVMLNLLSNAVKFTPAGGSVTVMMWENVVDGSLSIEVRDTGIGIAPKDISRAMAPFGQVDNTLSRKYEGTGLGLPLTRKFVEIMGGSFSIKSEVGKGTVITITLPKESHGKAARAETNDA